MTSFNFEGEFGQKYGVSMGTTGEHPRVFAETLGISKRPSLYRSGGSVKIACDFFLPVNPQGSRSTTPYRHITL